MKGRILIFAVIAVIVLAIGLGLWLYGDKDESQEASPAVTNQITDPKLPPIPVEEGPAMGFSQKMIDNFNYRLIAYPEDQIIPDVEVTDHTGEVFNLHSYLGKKVLFYFDVEGCESCLAYYAILEDWARDYQDELQIVMLFKNNYREGFEKELTDLGIRLVPYATEAIEAFDVNYTSNYLFDENGKIMYYFDFDYLQWTRIDQIIDSCIQNGELPKGVAKRDYLQKGQAVPEVNFGYDVTGKNKLQTNDLLGNPTLVFMNDQICVACRDIYPLVNKLSEKYQNKVNIIVLLNGLRTNEGYTAADQFYAKYELVQPSFYDVIFETETPILDYVKKNEIKVPVYPAFEKAMERWGVVQIPGVLILNDKGIVQDYLIFESQRLYREIPAEDYLIKELDGLIR